MAERLTNYHILMREKRIELTLVLLIGLLAGNLCMAQPETGFLERSVNVEGVDYRYQIFVPKDWTPDKLWPVISLSARMSIGRTGRHRSHHAMGKLDQRVRRTGRIVDR